MDLPRPGLLSKSASVPAALGSRQTARAPWRSRRRPPGFADVFLAQRQQILYSFARSSHREHTAPTSPLPLDTSGRRLVKSEVLGLDNFRVRALPGEFQRLGNATARSKRWVSDRTGPGLS